MDDRRVAVVTGGAGGIGWGISRALARTGLHVLIVNRDPVAETRAGELRDSELSAAAFRADLENVPEIEGVLDHIRQEYGRCDVLVNNAGVHHKTPEGMKYFLEEIALDEWQSTFHLNLVVPFLMSQGCVPLMRKQGWGRVINISSRAGRTGPFTVGAQYAAAKAGVLGLTRIIATEYGKYGITANAIAPGRVETAMEALSAESVRAPAIAEMPLGRLGTIDELGAVAAFLASDGAGFVTGAVIDANGGAFMG